MFGLLNLNKPSGITSRAAVNRVQQGTGRIKIGHAGTLDPLARGVLVVCLGPATRLVEFVQRMPKRYRGRFLFGCSSDTEDVQGQVRQLAGAPQPTPQQLESLLPAFVGRILQRPPAYSALKVAGRRAYRLAREGTPVDLTPRPIDIYELRLVGYDYPEFTLEIHCGAGTYVRSLGRDIAERLGTAAVMADLTRTAIGDFRLDQATPLDELSPESLPKHLLPAVTAVADLPRIRLSAPQRKILMEGLTIPNEWGVEGAEIVAVDADGRLAALLKPAPENRLRPVRNFPP